MLQDNYSHDNDGPGLMAYTYPYASYTDRENVIRFNISDGDSRKGDRYAGLWVRSDGNGITGLKVYNNTVRIGPRGKQAVYVQGKGVEAEFRNNVFIGSDRAQPLVVEEPGAKLRFVNNLYWSGGAPLRIQWGEQTYSSLREWAQTTGQESAGGKLLGLFVNPRLRTLSVQRPGPGSNWQERCLLYKPQPDSAIPTRGIAVIENLAGASSNTDILGQELAADRWPLGALGRAE